MVVDKGQPFRHMFGSDSDYNKAREEGRRRAALSILIHPEKKIEMEAVFGKEGCMRQYPEAYGLDTQPEYVLP